MTDGTGSLERARALLAAFAERDGSAGRVDAAVTSDRGLGYRDAVDLQKYPETYLPALALLFDLDLLRPGAGRRLLHLGANHGVFCRFLQDDPGVSLALALDLSWRALRFGCSWGLRAAVQADAVALAACRSGWADVVLAESLLVPGYWPAADLARCLEACARVLRPGGILIIQEWGFDPARVFAPELADAGLREVRRVTASALTQQGEREVTAVALARESCEGPPPAAAGGVAGT